MPRWYVWWRLWGQQEGRCATCSGPPQVIDHDHVTGLVRGLLCYECNTEEGACATDIALRRHPRVCWFGTYRLTPPGAPFSWYWPDPRRGGGVDGFLPHPSVRFAEQPKRPVRCTPRCPTWLSKPVPTEPDRARPAAHARWSFRSLPQGVGSGAMRPGSAGRFDAGGGTWK
ncbi:hypothetical protein GCM10010260_36570 [Streptomyces filipinensis]|uniref:Recombination endonuclease VII n=1 Tax=Streptomyces filipinensis TaxID=66887 RepID=A0A918IBY4_9ACTN|nr:endonuclease domain-containing protein [Streptomyces filipinensis]GGU97433.1 hypothetical protein GCM10010260_36570 [Streptomyces filipinensis]